MAQQPTINYSWSSGGASEAGPEYILAPHKLFEVANRQFLLVPRNGGERVLLDAQVVQALMLCDVFRRIGEHRKHIAMQIPALRNAGAQVETVLRQMAEKKLLLSKADVLSSLRSARDEHVETRDVFIRTCDRPDELGRVLSQLSNRTGASAGEYRVAIIDDSRERDSQARNQALAAEFSGRLELDYLGRERQAALLEVIRAAQAEQAAAATWLLDPAAHASAYTPGLGLNWMLLLSSGSSALLLDDDCELLVRPSPNALRALKIGPSSRSARFDGPGLRAQTVGEDNVDPLDAHAAMLGRGFGSVLADAGDGAEFDARLSHRDLETLAQSSPVVLTSNGTFGDPGIDRPHWLVDLDADSLDSLCRAGAGYTQNSRARDLWIGRHSLSVSQNLGSMATSVLLGLDNRHALPPVFPRHRSEDFLLGALSSVVVPGAMAVEFPWGLQHLPSRPRYWEREQFASCYQVGMLRVFADMALNQASAIQAGSDETRLLRLGEMYADHATLDDVALAHLIDEHVTYARSDLVRASEQLHARVDASREALREDLTAIIDTNLRELVSGKAAGLREMEAGFDAAMLRQALAAYGGALRAWPSLREQGAELRNQLTAMRT